MSARPRHPAQDERFIETFKKRTRVGGSPVAETGCAIVNGRKRPKSFWWSRPLKNVPMGCCGLAGGDAYGRSLENGRFPVAQPLFGFERQEGSRQASNEAVSQVAGSVLGSSGRGRDRYRRRQPRLSARIATRNRSERSRASPMTFAGWPTGSPSEASGRS
jgi:hypothetical protein